MLTVEAVSMSEQPHMGHWGHANNKAIAASARWQAPLLYLLLSPLTALAEAPAAASLVCPADSSVDEWRKASVRHFRQGDYTDAEGLERCVLDRVTALGERKAEAQSLNNLGVLARRRGDIDEAGQLYERSLQIRREIGDRNGTAQSLNNLAIIEKNRGNLYQALSLQLEALPIRREAEKPALIAESLDNIGLIYLALGDLDEAERHCREAIELVESLDKTDMLARFQINLGNILLQKESYGETRELAERSLALARGNAARPDISRALMLLAELNLHEGRADDARWAVAEAESIAVDIDDPKLLSEIRLLQASLLVGDARFGEAIDLAEQGLALARSNSKPLIERQWLQILKDAHQGNGDFENALSYSDLHETLDRELSNALTTREMADLRASLTLQQQQSQMGLLERDNRIQSLRIERQRMLGLALIGGILVLALAVWMFALRYRYSHRANQMLRSRSDALKQAARTDYLTGLPNRLALATQCEQLEHDAGPLAAILVDIDHFKRINDEHGHAAGDRALSTVARTLQDALPEATVGRWGGEEFLIVERIDSTSGLLASMDKLLTAIRAIELDLEHRHITLTISVGGALREPGESVNNLLLRVDRALYRAKADGRDRANVADDPSNDERR